MPEAGGSLVTALTPDDLARIEALAEKADDLLPVEAIEWDMTQDYLNHLIEAVPALVAGVRSLQARITELEGPPTEAQVEAAAQAMFEPDGPGKGDYSWAEMIREDQSRADIWREDARKVLTAAFTPVPASAIGVRDRYEEIAVLRQQRHDALARVTELERDLDVRFEHSDHQSAKYYQRMRKAEIREAAALAQVTAVEADRDAAVNEMHARELHHFEAEDLATELRARAEKAEKILLGGIGQSWRKVIDDPILTLRGVDHG